jgi:hypothetical protein
VHASQHWADLALIISDYVYRNIVSRHPSLVSPVAFWPVRFQIKYTRARAWTYVPSASRSRSSAGYGLLDTMNPNLPRGHSLQGTRSGPNSPRLRLSGGSLLGPNRGILEEPEAF